MQAILLHNIFDLKIINKFLINLCLKIVGHVIKEVYFYSNFYRKFKIKSFIFLINKCYTCFSRK